MKNAMSENFFRTCSVTAILMTSHVFYVPIMCSFFVLRKLKTDRIRVCSVLPLSFKFWFAVTSEKKTVWEWSCKYWYERGTDYKRSEVLICWVLFQANQWFLLFVWITLVSHSHFYFVEVSRFFKNGKFFIWTLFLMNNMSAREEAFWCPVLRDQVLFFRKKMGILQSIRKQKDGNVYISRLSR